MRIAIIALLGILFLCGCAPIWVPTNGQFQGAGYTLDLPQEWMATTNPKNLVVTHDGPELQRVFVYIYDFSDQGKDNNREKSSGKQLKKGMLPQEAAETVLDIMRSDKGLAQFTVVENKPAKVGGQDGFRLVYSYKADKLRMQCIYYGMLHNENYYRISYCAAVRYYFEKDVAEFEKIAASFKLN